MSKERLFIDVHALQTVPPSCINRDDTGSPKTAIYGGVTRARVSSQSWKHAMREEFADIFSEDKIGIRTKSPVLLVKRELLKLNPQINEEKAEEEAVSALEAAKISVNKKKGNDTEVLVFISPRQAEELAKLINEDLKAENKDPGKETSGKKDGKKKSEKKDEKKYLEAMKNVPSYDISLFGRMVAADKGLNVEAAAQVAHAISTHAVHNEYDYFTAVDDLADEKDNSGAAYLDTMEYNSSTLYRYASIDVKELSKTQRGCEEEIVKGFVEAFIRSMPSGKINSYANNTLPEMVYVTVRKDQPVNLVGAFEKPIKNTGEGFAEKSIDALSAYAKKIYENYCGAPEKAFAIGAKLDSSDESVNINELLEKVGSLVAKEVK